MITKSFKSIAVPNCLYCPVRRRIVINDRPSLKDESEFGKVAGSIERREGLSKERAYAIAATIGRRDLGQQEMTRRSVAGRKKSSVADEPRAADGKWSSGEGSSATTKKPGANEAERRYRRAADFAHQQTLNANKHSDEAYGTVGEKRPSWQDPHVSELAEQSSKSGNHGYANHFHLAAAEEHDEFAKKAKTTQEARRHKNAADEHREAADYHRDANEYKDKMGAK